MSDDEVLASRIRGEYLEMPGLNLTCAQACRLWQLDDATCSAVLSRLVAEGFLARTPGGAFVARLLPPAKAGLRGSRRPVPARRAS